MTYQEQYALLEKKLPAIQEKYLNFFKGNTKSIRDYITIGPKNSWENGVSILISHEIPPGNLRDDIEIAINEVFPPLPY
jgi:hypothetical protein